MNSSIFNVTVTLFILGLVLVYGISYILIAATISHLLSFIISQKVLYKALDKNTLGVRELNNLTTFLNLLTSLLIIIEMFKIVA